jgi:hypothetical protein
MLIASLLQWGMTMPAALPSAGHLEEPVVFGLMGARRV